MVRRLGDDIEIEALLELEVLRSAARSYVDVEGEIFDEYGEPMASYLITLCDVMIKMRRDHVAEGRYNESNPFSLMLEPSHALAAEIVLKHCATSHPDGYTKDEAQAMQNALGGEESPPGIIT